MISTDKNTTKQDFLNRFHVNEIELVKLCKKYGVKSLAIFGSGINKNFNPGKSDLDFLVEFDHVSFDIYFGLRDGLKILFKYEDIDLITLASLKNQFIKNEIFSTKENICAA